MLDLTEHQLFELGQAFLEMITGNRDTNIQEDFEYVGPSVGLVAGDYFYSATNGTVKKADLSLKYGLYLKFKKKLKLVAYRIALEERPPKPGELYYPGTSLIPIRAHVGQNFGDCKYPVLISKEAIFE